MAKLETKLEIIAGNNPAYNCIMTDNYSEVVASKEIVNNSNTFKSIASFGIASSIGSRLDVRGNATITSQPYEYLYSTNGGIRVLGVESAIDIISDAAGGHASSLLLRGDNEGYAFINNITDSRLELKSFTASDDAFYVHGAGEDVSSLQTIAEFNSSGDATFSGVISADGGIDFSGIQTNAAGMTSETLDSYEEGTWTPVLSRWSGGAISATYTTQTGTYTRIGRQVFIRCTVQISAVASQGTSDNYISGLPFTFTATDNAAACIHWNDAFTTTVVDKVLIQNNLSGIIMFAPEGNNQGAVAVDWKAGHVRVTGTYVC